MQKAILALLALLIIPLAAAEVTDISFTVDGEELNIVNYGSEVTGHLEFTPTPGAGEIQISSPAMERNIRTGGCDPCIVEATVQTSEQITFTFIEDVDGELKETEKTFQYTVDGDGPQITEVKLNDCSAGCAYSEQQKILRFHIQDTSGVNFNTVVIETQGDLYQPACAETIGHHVCMANLTRMTGDATIRIRGTDIAGNTAEKLMEARYDATPPQIVEGPQFLDRGTVIPAQSPSNLWVKVEESETATITVNSQIYNGTADCRRESGQQLECIIQVVPTRPYEGEMKVIITDAAGNTHPQTIQVKVLEATPDFEPDFWTVSASPNRWLDPLTWKQAKNYPVFLELSPRQTASANIEPVHMQVSDCVLPGVDGGIKTAQIAPNTETLLPMTLGAPDSGMLENPDSDLYKTNMTCKLEIWTRSGNVVFEKPEVEQMTFEPRFIDSRQFDPRQVIEDEQERVAIRIQEQDQMLASQEKFLNMLQTTCNVPGFLKGASMSINTVGAAASAFPGVGDGPAAVANQAADWASDAGDAYSPLASKACTLVTCDFGTNKMDQMLKGLSPDSDDAWMSGPREAVGGAMHITGLDNSQAFFDPYKSLPVAAATLCWPAVVHHQRSLLNIDCQYSACVHNADDNGLLLDECSSEKSFQECRQVQRQVYFVNPLNVATDYMYAQAEVLLDNPLSLLGIGISAACGTFPDHRLGIACRATTLTNELSNLMGTYNQMQQVAETFTAYGGSDACSLARQAAREYETPRPLMINDVYCGVGVTHVPIRDRDYYVLNGEIYGRTSADAGRDGDGLPTEAEAVGGIINRNVQKIKPSDLPDGAHDRIMAEYENCQSANPGVGSSLDPVRDAVQLHEQASERLRVTERSIRDAQRRYDEARAASNQENDFEQQAQPANWMSETSYRLIRSQYITCYSSGQEDCDTLRDMMRLSYEDSMGVDCSSNIETHRMCEEAFDSLQEDMHADPVLSAETNLATQEGRLDEDSDNAKEAKRAARRARDQWMHDQLANDPASVKARRAIRMGMAYSALYRNMQSLVPWDPLDGIWMDDNWFTEQRSQVDEYVNDKCSDLEGGSVAAAYDDPTGQPIAMISAYADHTDEDSDYVITFRLAIPQEIATGDDDPGKASIVLEGGADEFVRQNISLSRPHASNTIPVSLPDQYTKACIEFPQQLRTYYSSVRGSVGEGERLCTTIREVDT